MQRRSNASNAFGVEETPPSSPNFDLPEINSSPTTRNNSLRNYNTGRLNEKYAMMQQKMSQMVQEIRTPPLINKEPPKTPKRHPPVMLRELQARDEEKSPFLVSPTPKWPGNRKKRELELDDDSELGNFLKRSQSDSWPPRTFKRKDTGQTKVPTNTQSSSTPPHRRSGFYSRAPTEPFRYFSRTEPRRRPPSSFTTPKRSTDQKYRQRIMRKHATRFASVWPPQKPLPEGQGYEEEMEALLESAPVSPSPTITKSRSEEDINHLSSLVGNFDMDDKEDEQASPTHVATNIYTHQLTQQNLSFDDAANPPLATNLEIEEFFVETEEFTRLENRESY
ncbi:5673_t:CDS:2 [Acaulospora morrowiae]|uniref:5673_t:CDS:1 n=1 Tax=Acaulospora morrowiae TaxID=94023 RepID=A0A9N8VW30_9GLOM|nr:5673_t:CDS:2 [Acaulospora morrowiae]